MISVILECMIWWLSLFYHGVILGKQIEKLGNQQRIAQRILWPDGKSIEIIWLFKANNTMHRRSSVALVEGLYLIRVIYKYYACWLFEWCVACFSGSTSRVNKYPAFNRYNTSYCSVSTVTSQTLRSLYIYILRTILKIALLSIVICNHGGYETQWNIYCYGASSFVTTLLHD